MRMPEVVQTTGLSRSTVYNLLKAPASKFPRPVSLTGAGKCRGAIGFRSDQVFAWLEALSR